MILEKTTNMNWNENDPRTIGNYIVDIGAWGVCLGWFDGTSWVKMWSNEPINVYGWIEIPKY